MDDDKKKSRAFLRVQEELNQELEKLFESHLSICSEINVITRKLSSSIGKIEDMEKKCNSVTLRHFIISKRLKIHELKKNVLAAKQNISRINKLSSILNENTRESISREIEESITSHK